MSAESEWGGHAEARRQRQDAEGLTDAEVAQWAAQTGKRHLRSLAREAQAHRLLVERVEALAAEVAEAVVIASEMPDEVKEPAEDWLSTVHTRLRAALDESAPTEPAEDDRHWFVRQGIALNCAVCGRLQDDPVYHLDAAAAAPVPAEDATDRVAPASSYNEGNER